ncbi:MAG: type II secretion system F family protein [Candidatus Scalindua sp.]|nr:type II secretion system F family protein [Candidatus Scalindua sp.]
MPTFKFKAIDKKGILVKDWIEALSNEEAIRKVGERGFFLTSIKETRGLRKNRTRNKEKKKPPTAFLLSRINPKEIDSFTRELSTLQEAGISIVESLIIIESELKKGLLKTILTHMIRDIQEGNNLSGAMQKHPKAFDKLYVNTIKAGEIGGALDIILDRLANYREKIRALKLKIISSITYPLAVVFVACAIISGIMIFIIPSFSKMFDELDISLPWITVMIISLSDFMISRWYVIFGFPVALFVLYKLIMKMKRCRLIKDRITLKLPVIGSIISKSVISKFVRTLSTLTSSGVPILQSLNNVKDVTANTALRNAIEYMHNKVREGEKIAKTLRDTKICKPTLVSMIEIGEQSGKLDMMLARAADNYDKEIDAAVTAMISLLEPLMVTFIGCAIGTIVLALFMPLIKLMSSMGSF